MSGIYITSHGIEGDKRTNKMRFKNLDLAVLSERKFINLKVTSRAKSKWSKIWIKLKDIYYLYSYLRPFKFEITQLLQSLNWPIFQKLVSRCASYTIQMPKCELQETVSGTCLAKKSKGT